MDEPPGESIVVWVREDELDEDRAQILSRCLTEFDWPPLGDWLEGILF